MRLLNFVLFILSLFTIHIVFAQHNYFEGQITYDVNYTPDNDSYSNHSLRMSIGSRIVFTFKDGNSKKEYFNPTGELLSTRYLNLDLDKSFAVYSGQDTVLWFDITENGSLTEYTYLNDTIIDGYECLIAQAKSSTTVYGETYNFSSDYCMGKSLRVNPEWFVNYKEGNYNEFVMEMPYIFVESNNHSFYWTQHIKLEKVEARKVKKSEVLYKPNKKTPLKELK